jgi:hypothetical protein
MTTVIPRRRSEEPRRDRRRLVVTGIGLVSPSGLGTKETWQSILAGRSGIAPIMLSDASLRAVFTFMRGTPLGAGGHDEFSVLQNESRDV